MRKPQVVEGLRGKKIVHVAVGALHCLAVTDAGQVSRGRDGPWCQRGNSPWGEVCLVLEGPGAGPCALVPACVCPVVSGGDTGKVSLTDAC